MNTIYLTYERFLEAARKFPRWSNVKRRPITSLGGKLLQSIVEEIGKVEDAIIEYKKDFFIVNYIGREDTIVDYLYNAQIGNIENLDELSLISPQLQITDDIKVFYSSAKYAYYQDGYIVFRNAVNELEYTYGNFKYKVPVEKFHVWNIFDEFAWWVGLERFENETNKELVNRTINIFRYKPNSSEEGLKNVIFNTLSTYGYIDKDREISFEIPGKENISSDLYEIISQFNHDIARTKRWDIDYWDNQFRSLGYLPHEWDALVKHYKDGVGYNNSLYVSTVKDLDTEGKTNVTIHGYKKSEAKIEEYIKNQNISKDINLGLTKYNNIINPINVRYKIIASDLTKIDKPDQVYIDSYLTSNREQSYYIDDLITSTEELSVIDNRKLEADQKYILELTPAEETFEIDSCDLVDDNGSQNLLTPKGSFDYNDRGLFVNTKVLFHADSTGDLSSSTNLTDYRYGGVTLIDAGIPGNFTINAEGIGGQPLTIKSECDLYDITANQTYITYNNQFTFDGSNYISSNNDAEPSILQISFLGRDLEFSLDKADSNSLASGYADIETYINGSLDQSNSYYNVSVKTFNKYSLKQNKMTDIVVKVTRKTTTPIKINNIRCSRYDIKIMANGAELNLSNKNSVTLPKASENYSLNFIINSYGQTKPVVKSVHIGANLNSLNSKYSIDIDTTGKVNPYISLNGNCNYHLFKENGEEINFKPFNSYKNDTDQIRGIYLDLSDFKDIVYSSPEIRYDNGIPYISVEPHTTVDSIVIYGQSEKLQSRNNLKTIFNLGTSEDIFVNKNLKSFIKKIGSKEELLDLTESMCSNKNSNTYKIWSNQYKNLIACYISDNDKNVEFIGDKYTGQFEKIYIYDKGSQDYIAYNDQNIIKNITENINIVKNFSPTIPDGQDLLFYIDTVETRSLNKFNVTFDNGNRWSTSITRKIRIETEIDLSNSNVINATITNLSQNFVLSNNIQLEDNYTVNDEEIELGLYIITPPENMVISYEEIAIEQSADEDGATIFIEEDGFNKLYYSNIVKINKVISNDQEISADKYTLLNEEGIICWNDDNLIGQPVKFEYVYKKPKYLTFSNLDYLYDLVGYYIDTLEEVETITDYIINNCQSGSIIQIDYNYFLDKPDRIVAECSNPCYTGIFNNDTVIINKIAEDNSIVIHNGYYYIDGKEYWYFADKYQYESDKLNGVKTNNIDKTDSGLLMQMESSNYLLNSRMLCNTMDTHCMIDFNYYRNIPNISSLDHIGACESFSAWNSYNMSISLSDEYDNHCIVFNQQDKDAYAILDVTTALKNKKFISCWYAGNLKFALGKEIKIENNKFTKGFYVERIKEFDLYKDKAYCNTRDLFENDFNYYLIVTGSGTLIEVIVSDSNSIEDIDSDHEKVISKLGLNIEESIEPDNEIVLDYTNTGAILENAEISEDGSYIPGMTVDWGITKVRRFDLKDQTYRGFLLRNDNLIAQSDDCYLETSPISISDKSIIFNAFLKINDYPYNNLKDFNVKVLGSNSLNGTYNEILSVTNTNLVIIQNSKLTNYIKFRITAKESQVITSLELYFQYREIERNTIKISEYDRGSITSKIFDTAVTANYRIKEIIGSAENANYSVRAARIGNTDTVWTDWYNIDDNHVFNEYRLFQFKIDLKAKNAKAKINQIIMEVVE